MDEELRKMLPEAPAGCKWVVRRADILDVEHLFSLPMGRLVVALIERRPYSTSDYIYSWEPKKLAWPNERSVIAAARRVMKKHLKEERRKEFERTDPKTLAKAAAYREKSDKRIAKHNRKMQSKDAKVSHLITTKAK